MTTTAALLGLADVADLVEEPDFDLPAWLLDDEPFVAPDSTPLLQGAPTVRHDRGERPPLPRLRVVEPWLGPMHGPDLYREPLGPPAPDRVAASSPRRITGRAVLAVGLLVVLLWFTWPARLGGATSYVVVKGTSMQPLLHGGDLAVVRRASSYHPGDLVLYRVPNGQPGAGHLVIHRIRLRTTAGTYVMRGDNRTTNDSWTPTDHDILGRYVFHLDHLGRWVIVLSSPLAFAVVAGIIVSRLSWPQPLDDQSEATPRPKRPKRSRR